MIQSFYHNNNYCCCVNQVVWLYNKKVYTETPLHVAASLGSADCLRLLLSHQADVRVQYGATRSTALHLAAEEGSAECVKLLLQAGAPWDARNSRGQTAMHLAALVQASEALELLISAGAEVNVEDDDGRSPLHAAVAKATRSTEAVKILLMVYTNIIRIHQLFSFIIIKKITMKIIRGGGG